MNSKKTKRTIRTSQTLARQTPMQQQRTRQIQATPNQAIYWTGKKLSVSLRQLTDCLTQIRFFNRGGDIQEESNIKTRFSDVLGIDEFKEELIELVDYLKNPSKYHEAGAKLPKGNNYLFSSC